jgi:hypothetical protein
MFAMTSIAPAPAAASSGRPPARRGSRLRRSTAAAISMTASSPIRPAATGQSAPDCPALRMRRKNRPNDAPETMP